MTGQPPRSLDKNDRQIEDCFYRAYQRCAPVTLSEHFMGVDTGSNSTYWPVRQNGACRVMAQFSTYGMVPSGNQTSTVTCQGMTRKNGGLLISRCGMNGDVFIPSGQ